jgi:hypothetical protein
MTRCRLAGTFAVLLSFSCLVSGQTTGEVRGLVTDPSGGGVPAAKVVLTSRETGEVRNSTTDGEGRYAFPLLKIGDYAITVEAAGFRRTVADANVRSAEITAVNLRLELGQVTEQITVLDAANPLDTQNAQVQESFNSRQVQEIPVARDPNIFAYTLPGVIPAPTTFNSGSFVSSGNRIRANNITIDNITATDVSVAGTGSTNLGPLNFSQIKEVKVITNTFSAEFGRNSGSQMQYITKSGTNELHGELYEYLRNNVLNARDFFDRTGKSTVTRRNQFGGVLGGPIVRNKTHFFLAAEILPQRGAGGARSAQVPTASMAARVTDPTSRQLLERYQIPIATTDQGDFGTVQQNAPTTTDFYQYSVRVDHQFSEKDIIFGRYAVAQSDAASSANNFINTNIAGFGLNSTNRPYSANINEIHIFSPSVVNEFRAGFGRTSPIFSLIRDNPGPRIIFANGQVDQFGHYEGGPQGRIQNTYQVGDTVTWTRGAHNIKAGGDFFRYQGNSFFEVRTRGDYTFNNWDDFAAGRPVQYRQQFGGTVRGHRTWLSGMFVQDDYRVTPALTLNLGFRLEIFGAVNEVNRITSNLEFDCRDSLGAAGSGPLGCITVGEDVTRNNFYWQPRIGLAWNPGNGKTVVRAGYGLVADFNFLNPITNQRALPPFVVTQTIAGVTSFTGGNTFANLIAGTAPIQAEGLSQVGRIPNDILNYGDVNPVISGGLENPQVHQWSLGVQRQLPAGIVAKVTYVGTKGNFLQRSRQVNLNGARPRPAASLEDETARLAEFQSSFTNMTGNVRRFSTRLDPRFNVVNYYDSSANSNYHAMEVFITRAFKSGYSFQAAYTLSKSIDDVSDGLSNIPNDSAIIQDPLNLRSNRAVSAFDAPQRLVIAHVFELPWGSRLGNAALRHVLGGWGFAGISSFRSGFPVSLEAGSRYGINNIPLITTGGLTRPNTAGAFAFVPQPANSAGAPQGLNNDPIAGRRIAVYAQSLGLSQPLLGNYGNLGRNSHRANGETSFDWNIYKNTNLTERLMLQLRCEAYNLFNHVSFRDVNRNISNPGFGQYTNNNLSQRIIQLGVSLRF